MAPPGLNHSDRLVAGSKPLGIEALVAQAAVEALVGAVLPGLSGGDVGCVDAGLIEPLQNGRGYELGAVVGSQVPGSAVHADELGQYLDDSSRSKASRDINGQRLAGPLVDHGQALHLAERRFLTIQVVRFFPRQVRASSQVPGETVVGAADEPKFRHLGVGHGDAFGRVDRANI